MAPVNPPTLYIDGKPYFLEAPPRATKLPYPWLLSPRRMAHLQHQEDLRKKEDKGAVLS
jgi:hypothetical protein